VVRLSGRWFSETEKVQKWEKLEKSDARISWVSEFVCLLYPLLVIALGTRIWYYSREMSSNTGSNLKYTLYVGTHSVTVTLGTG